jgi:hypothetical protein
VCHQLGIGEYGGCPPLLQAMLRLILHAARLSRMSHSKPGFHDWNVGWDEEWITAGHPPRRKLPRNPVFARARGNPASERVSRQPILQVIRRAGTGRASEEAGFHSTDMRYSARPACVSIVGALSAVDVRRIRSARLHLPSSASIRKQPALAKAGGGPSPGHYRRCSGAGDGPNT